MKVTTHFLRVLVFYLDYKYPLIEVILFESNKIIMHNKTLISSI